MSKHTLAAATATLLLLIGGLGHASATTYEFSFFYSGSGGAASGSGFLFGTDLGGGLFLLTSGSGTSTEAGNLTLEPAGTYINTLPPSVNLTSDNLLSPGSNPVLNGNGIVFSGDALVSNSQYINIWGNGADSYSYFNNYDSFPYNSFTLDSFTVANLGVAPVPLPASFPLMVAGLGLVGLIGWRSKRKAAAVLAA